MNSQKIIAVLGGGAAGMMAAVSAAEQISNFENGGIVNDRMKNNRIGEGKARILLFEKNAYLGAKVLISGGGRCNVTTGIFDVRKLMENYPRGAKFLMSAMFRFPPEKVKDWFEAHGVPLKIEEDLRIFPVSNNGKDVVGTLERELKRLNVEVFVNANVIEVSGLTKANDGAMQKDTAQKFYLKLKDGRVFEADAVIITTGGNAYRHTGSTGDGYAFAKNFGHMITPLSPSLNSFVVSEKWVSKLAGVSFEKVKLTLRAGVDAHVGMGAQAKVCAEADADVRMSVTPVPENEPAGANNVHADEATQIGPRMYERTGPIVFTHVGVSGPAVFATSARASYEQYDKLKPMQLLINFFPDESAETLEKRFMKLADEHGKKSLVNFLDMLLPRSLCEVIIDVLKADPGLIVGRLPKTLRLSILKHLQSFELTVVGRGAGEEFVTAGGVALDEVNTNTMESKIQPGLYFAGEILDIDGFTGGFNLQASWATGKLAGESAVKNLLSDFLNVISEDF